MKDNITIEKYPRLMLSQWTLAPDTSAFNGNGKAIFVLAPMSETTPAPEVLPMPTPTPDMDGSSNSEEEMFESEGGYDFDEAMTTPTPLTFRYYSMATPSPRASMYPLFDGTFPTPAPTPEPKAGYSLSQFTTALPDFGYSSPEPLRMVSPRPTPTMSRVREQRRLIMPTTTPRPRATPRPKPNVTATPGEEYAPLSLLIQLSTPVPETPSQPDNEQLLFENPVTPSPGGAPYFYNPTMSPSPAPGFLFSNGGNGYGNGNGNGDGNGNGNMMNQSPRFWKPTMTPMVKPTVTPMSLY